MSFSPKGRAKPLAIGCKKYKWAPNSRMKGDVSLVMAEMLPLFDKYGDRLKPMHVVKAAKNSKSYLHKYFTWDLVAAQKKLWIIEAQKLLRSVNTVIVVGKKTPITVRTIVSVPDKNLCDSVHSYYTPVESAVADKTAMDRLKQKALMDLKNWRERNAMIQGLEPLFEAIDKFLGC